MLPLRTVPVVDDLPIDLDSERELRRPSPDSAEGEREASGDAS
jgi:hypothetical protein